MKSLLGTYSDESFKGKELLCRLGNHSHNQRANRKRPISLLKRTRMLADGLAPRTSLSKWSKAASDEYRHSALPKTEPHSLQDKGRMDIAVQERKDDRQFSIPRAGLTGKAARAVKPVDHAQGCWPVGKSLGLAEWAHISPCLG